MTPRGWKPLPRGCKVGGETPKTWGDGIGDAVTWGTLPGTGTVAGNREPWAAQPVCFISKLSV